MSGRKLVYRSVVAVVRGVSFVPRNFLLCSSALDAEKDLLLIFQVLLYPPLQAADFKLPSYVQHNEAVIASAEEIAMVFLAYMGLDMDYAAAVSTPFCRPCVSLKSLLFSDLGFFLFPDTRTRSVFSVNCAWPCRWLPTITVTHKCTRLSGHSSRSICLNLRVPHFSIPAVRARGSPNWSDLSCWIHSAFH